MCQAPRRPPASSQGEVQEHGAALPGRQPPRRLAVRANHEGPNLATPVGGEHASAHGIAYLQAVKADGPTRAVLKQDLVDKVVPLVGARDRGRGLVDRGPQDAALVHAAGGLDAGSGRDGCNKGGDAQTNHHDHGSHGQPPPHHRARRSLIVPEPGCGSPALAGQGPVAGHPNAGRSPRSSSDRLTRQPTTLSR
jgi:hypothetical protein